MKSRGRKRLFTMDPCLDKASNIFRLNPFCLKSNVPSAFIDDITSTFWLMKLADLDL